MPARVPEKIQELDAYVRSIRSRMSSRPDKGNAVQSYRAELFEEMRDDYQLSLQKAKERQG